MNLAQKIEYLRQLPPLVRKERRKRVLVRKARRRVFSQRYYV